MPGLLLVLALLPIIQQEVELMEWHPSGVTRTRIRVIKQNFCEILIRRKEILLELAKRGILVIRVRVNRVKLTEKWGEIKGNGT